MLTFVMQRVVIAIVIYIFFRCIRHDLISDGFLFAIVLFGIHLFIYLFGFFRLKPSVYNDQRIEKNA